MGLKTKKTEGGSGGKKGHSNMTHWSKTEDIKKDTKKGRRVQDKKIIKDSFITESNNVMFLKFLESLKGGEHNSLIESVKKGFQTCVENFNKK